MQPVSRLAGFCLALAWAHCAGAQEPLYRLPWPEGRTFMFTQAPGGKITTHFAKSSRYAVDIAMLEGTPVLAARRGVVTETESRHGASADEEPITDLGNYVQVRHEDGTLALYAHLRHRGVEVEPGEQVEAGRLLGYSGTTGFSSGPHLHFGVSRLERPEAGLPGEMHEVSVPVTFTVGAPPVTFEPRAAMMVTATYSSPAEFPRAPSDKRLVEWKPPVLAQEDLPLAWIELVAWLAAAAAGFVWFWRFSRS